VEGNQKVFRIQLKEGEPHPGKILVFTLISVLHPNRYLSTFTNEVFFVLLLSGVSLGLCQRQTAGELVVKSTEIFWRPGVHATEGLETPIVLPVLKLMNVASSYQLSS